MNQGGSIYRLVPLISREGLGTIKFNQEGLFWEEQLVATDPDFNHALDWVINRSWEHTLVHQLDGLREEAAS